MRKLGALCFLLFLFTVPAEACVKYTGYMYTDKLPIADCLHIHNSEGGHMDFYERARLQYSRIILSGYCESACAFMLAFPQTCYRSNTMLLFHMVRMSNLKTKEFIRYNAMYTQNVINRFPAKFRNYLSHIMKRKTFRMSINDLRHYMPEKEC